MYDCEYVLVRTPFPGQENGENLVLQGKVY